DLLGGVVDVWTPSRPLLASNLDLLLSHCVLAYQTMMVYCYNSPSVIDNIITSTACSISVVVAVACCLGNLLVIWAVWTSGALKQPTFCFIVALAVADLLVGFVTIPLAVLLGVHINTSFYGCLFMCCMTILLEGASVFLLLAIAVDRFLRVYIPLRYKSTVSKKRSWIVVAICCLAAALLSFTPMFGWHKTFKKNTFECRFFAVIPYEYFVNFLFFGFFLPPLAIMTGLYCYIFLTTRRQLRANIGVASRSSTYYQKEHRLAVSLVLVLGLFAVCWLPLFIMVTVRLYGHDDMVSSGAVDIGVLLSHANSAVNPIVYALKIPKIKEACRNLWRRVYCNREQQQSEQNNTDKNSNVEHTGTNTISTNDSTAENRSAT
ncbi:hypothetical protein NFI96_009685, partial [Prochilodus magdalenae]